MGFASDGNDLTDRERAAILAEIRATLPPLREELPQPNFTAQEIAGKKRDATTVCRRLLEQVEAGLLGAAQIQKNQWVFWRLGANKGDDNVRS